MSTWYIFCDGGSRNNPGNAASGYVIYNTDTPFESVEKALSECNDSTEVIKNGVFLGIKTNNEAEWMSLYYALEELQKHDTAESDSVIVFMDSNLVINQVQQKWKIKESRLRDIFISVSQLMSPIEAKIGKKIQFHHIYRKHNGVADSMVNEVLDSK